MNTALEIEWDHFVHSPSRKDGIPEHVERHLRSDTCKFIDEFGKEASLGGKIRLLACSLFHTFYLRVSFKTIPRWEIAVACLIIAAKIENKVQTIKKMTRAAANYLRPNLHFNDPTKRSLPPQQFYHWMSQIHIRERQIIERLYGELRTSLPIQSLHINTLRETITDKNSKLFPPKNKHVSNVFLGCFQILRKIFRSVLCIYYPPPWLAAVAVFKSLKRYNVDRLIPPKPLKKSKKSKCKKEPIYKQPPKLYLTHEWFRKYDLLDLSSSLNLNIIQYISDEIDACDDEVISVRDYTRKPAELYGIADLALLKRTNLVRSTPFNRLPIQMQEDLRNCFKLKKTQYIDLRCNVIKEHELKNKQIQIQTQTQTQAQNTNNKQEKEENQQEQKGSAITMSKLSSPPNINYRSIAIGNDPSSDWIFGQGPKQRDIIKALRFEHKKLQKSLQKTQPNPNLEEGEIEDEEEQFSYKNNRKMYNNNNNNNNRKRKRNWNNNNTNNNNNTFRNRNSNKNFETKSNQRRRRNIKEDLFHCGLETYRYVKRENNNNNNNKRQRFDEDSDMFYMNFCIQRFEYKTDGSGTCVSCEPKIESYMNDEEPNEFIYRIPTPNYMAGNTPSDVQNISPVTPGYGISPITPGYMGATACSLTPKQQLPSEKGDGNGNGNGVEAQNEYWERTYRQYENQNDLNDGSAVDIIGNNNAFTTKTQRNNYQTVEPPNKKMKLSHRTT